MFEFCDKLKLSVATAHVATAYFDILTARDFAAQKQKDSVEPTTPTSDKQRKHRLTLRAHMCVMLAAKYDELDDRIPLIRDIQKLAKY
jgi:hypothetical protein